MPPQPKPTGKSVTPISDNLRQPWAPREGIAVPMVDPKGEVVFLYEDNPNIILHGPPNETPVEAWCRDISNQEQFIALVKDHNRALAYAISKRERAAERERIAQQRAEEERAANKALARARTASVAPVRLQYNITGLITLMPGFPAIYISSDSPKAPSSTIVCSRPRISNANSHRKPRESHNPGPSGFFFTIFFFFYSLVFV
jgi:hypothetical protein